MSYDCPDFYDDVCRAAGEHLGVQFTEHEGIEIDCDAESVVLAIKRAAKERAELLALLCSARDELSDLNQSENDGGKFLRKIDRAIAKVQA